MTNKKDLIIVVLATFCLTSTLFMIIPTRSQEPGQYDPWIDNNEDGIIDILDAIALSNYFMTTGDPTKNATATNIWELESYYKLTVDSIIDRGMAAAGNFQPVRCFVIVSYQGEPVSNLTMDNFTISVISTPLGDPDGGLAFGFEGEPSNGTGVYVIHISPSIPGRVWETGTYVFTIRVYAKCVANLNVSPQGPYSANAAKGINSPNLLIT